MKHLIALLAFAISSAAFAEGEVIIRCSDIRISTLDRIEFRQTDLTGQYYLVEMNTDGSETLVVDSKGALVLVNYSEIMSSAHTPREVELSQIWGSPTVLRMNGPKSFDFVVKDVCEEITSQSMTCEWL